MKDKDEAATTKPRRRFIAGAVCPQCRELDRLVVERISETVQRRLCVACGFSDEVSTGGGAGVPRGKHDQPRRVPQEASVVRIVEIDGGRQSES